MNNVSTKQMLDYLRIAVQMENDCRSSDLLAGKISARAREINSTKYYTEQQYLLDVARDPADLKKEKLMPRWLKLYFIFVPISLVSALFQSFKFFVLAGLIYLALFVGIMVFLKSRRKKREQEAAQRHIVYKNKLDNANHQREVNAAIIDNYSVQFEEAKNAHSIALNNLHTLYSENILPEKYRNFAAVTTMYQWLRDGRCTEIYGHGGLYDTYEYNLQIGQIIGSLNEINRKLDIVISNQNLLYNEIKRGNDIAERTYQSVRRIEENSDKLLGETRQIKQNTEIIAREEAYQSRLQEYATYRALYY